MSAGYVTAADLRPGDVFQDPYGRDWLKVEQTEPTRIGRVLITARNTRTGIKVTRTALPGAPATIPPAEDPPADLDTGPAEDPRPAEADA